MLPCPFPRELPLYSIRQTRRPPLSYRTAAGGRCYLPDPVPEPRHVIASRGIRRTDRVSTRDATGESTFPWPHIGAEVFRTSCLDRPPGTDDRRYTDVAPSDRQPLHITLPQAGVLGHSSPHRRSTPVQGVRSAPDDPLGRKVRSQTLGTGFRL